MLASTSVATPAGVCNLHMAVKLNNLDLVDSLLKSKIAQNHFIGVNALSKNGYCHILKRLLAEKNLLLNQQDRYGKTPLHYAAEYGHVQACRLLMDHGASPYYKDQNGRLPMHQAAQMDQLSVVAFLLKNIDLNNHIGELDDQQNNLLHCAMTPYLACASQGKVLRFLVRHPAIRPLLNQKNRYGYTPCYCAMLKESFLDGLKRVSDYIDPNIPSQEEERTPLHEGVLRNNLASVVQLLNHFKGVEVNARDSDGNTALHYAVDRYNHPKYASKVALELVKVLLKTARVDLGIKNHQGETPLDRAKQNLNASEKNELIVWLEGKHPPYEG